MNRSLAVAVALVLVIALMGAVFVVREGEQVILTQFGKPVGDPITTPGLKLKVPLVQKIHRFEKRFLEWDGEANQLTTRDKTFIWVDAYARWHITDPLLFFQRLRDERGAQTRLDDILDGEIRNAIAGHDLVEVIRSSNREPEEDESLTGDEAGTLATIRVGRERIRQEVLRKAQARTGDLGIEILDVRLKRINYFEGVRENVYQRMISERKRIATRFRSEGDGEASRIRGDQERDLKEITSEAYRRAQEIRGRADAEAARIYAAAFNQSADTRQLYEFLQSMETLRATIDPETVLILATDGELLRFLEDSRP
jgi:membrane protease subunit HflC